MSNVTHAQQLFDKMDFKKLKPLNSSLEDISKDLREQLKDEFDLENLSYEDREDLHRGVEEIIKKSKKTSEGKKISELDKKRYLVLRRELAFRYPPKIKLTDDIAEKLISRDQLASDIRKNREANFGNGRPKGNIKINAKGLEINLDEEIYKKKIDEFKKYLSETE